MATLGMAATVGPASAASPHGTVKDPVSYVNPLIGTSNAGNTYPGAVQPFGMLAWSPQNSKGKQVSTPAPGGYQYDATKVRGFSLTHLNGVGCSGANGDIPIMPYVGDVDSSPSADVTDAKYASTFSHADETGAGSALEHFDGVINPQPQRVRRRSTSPQSLCPALIA